MIHASILYDDNDNEAAEKYVLAVLKSMAPAEILLKSVKVVFERSSHQHGRVMTGSLEW